jgi:hypothetical protein
MTVKKINELILHTGCYVKIEQDQENEVKVLWLMLKKPKDENCLESVDVPMMRIQGDDSYTPVKKLTEKIHQILLQSGVRFTLMAFADKMGVDGEDEGKKIILPEHVKIIT